jgi:hypothetical protein
VGFLCCIVWVGARVVVVAVVAVVVAVVAVAVAVVAVVVVVAVVAVVVGDARYQGNRTWGPAEDAASCRQTAALPV